MSSATKTDIKRYINEDKRSGLLSYRRRVPKQFQIYDARKIIKRSLHTREMREAISAAMAINKATEDYWNALILTGPEKSMARYENAVARSRALGWQYIPADKLPKIVDEDFVKRVLSVEKSGQHDKSATLGMENTPGLLLSEAWEIYQQLCKSQIASYTPKEKHRFFIPKKLAYTNFIKQIGDLPIAEIPSEVALDFRDWLLLRIEEGDLKPNTTNRMLGNIGILISKVSQNKRLGLPDTFQNLRFKDTRKKRRPPYSRVWVTNTMFAPGALDGLNVEARMVVYVIASTGARMSEIVGLEAEDVSLDGPVPYMSIRENSPAMVKTQNAIRDIPLCGSALFAIRQQYSKLPAGWKQSTNKGSPPLFPGYAGKNDWLSAVANKYLRQKGLQESPEHSLYGFRHLFQDGMIENNEQDRVQADLMGHEHTRTRYGKGPGMEQLRQAVLKISFDAPSSGQS